MHLQPQVHFYYLPSNSFSRFAASAVSSELPKVLMKLNEENPIESITFVGLCTDICVISNVMVTKAFLPEVLLIVDASCCAGVTPESHKNALEAMKVCQVKIENE